MDLKFYRCSHCGKIIIVAKESGVPVMCCGQKMEEIIPGTTDAAAEKHVPVIRVQGNCTEITVGEVAHPMAEEHYIEFIALQTSRGYQIKYLKPGEEPKAEFALTQDEKAEAAFAYCNLHSLWRAE